MCEIILIYYLQKQIGETYEKGGRDSTLIRILFVVSWILAELFGIIIGAAITGDMLGGMVLGVFGVIGVVIIFFVIANAVPATRRTERGYMDDYNEYRATGRISGGTRRRRRRRSEEDEEDDRPRRPDEDDEDDRPRRRVASRDEDEDDRPRRRPARDEDDERPRRRDDRVRRDDEDEPKPRRRLREDEDY